MSATAQQIETLTTIVGTQLRKEAQANGLNEEAIRAIECALGLVQVVLLDINRAATALEQLAQIQNATLILMAQAQGVDLNGPNQ